MQAARDRGQTPYVIHLGDHDPSGIDMTRDNIRRLEMLSDGEVTVERIALNRDQIDRYRPPPNPTKLTDSRADDYINEHGYECWELDALDPSVVVDLVQKAIEPLVDEDVWEEDLSTERDQKAVLRGVSENWSEIEEMIRAANGEGGDDEDDTE